MPFSEVLCRKKKAKKKISGMETVMKELETIAHIRNGFTVKFGIPRQSGLTDAKSRIVFEPKYRVQEAFRGLEVYSHIWLLWEFSESIRDEWSPTVRPPRLGGNQRVGVFATRSPFRPNPIGLSVVKLERIDWKCEDGPVLFVSGADILDGTPVYDVKPYLPHVDSIPEAEGGFAGLVKDYKLRVEFSEEYRRLISEEEAEVLAQLLEQDPRPAYQNNPERIYGLEYGGLEVKFKVGDGCVYVLGIEKMK